MKKTITIITLLAIITSCNSGGEGDSSARSTNTRDSSLGSALYVHDWSKNDIRNSRSLRVIFDTLSPDPANPKRNIIHKDTLYMVAMPVPLLDSLQKQKKDSTGELIYQLHDFPVAKINILQYNKWLDFPKN